MSESSSPYVHVHPISPSSSLSSTDSAPRSEPTSDEQPDLGAFTTVLREWTHLQPPPRIPVQIRSATSSTTPTYHADQSVTGSDFHSRSRRSRNSQNGTASAVSTLSSFTRPPSSSLQPDGSTVWAHAPIASYLYSATPSNDQNTDEDEDAYTPSPNSMASTALTVEITSELDSPSFDETSQDRRDLSPSLAMSLALSSASDTQRLDSIGTAHPDEEVVIVSSISGADDSSLTSRDVFRDRTYTSSIRSQTESSPRIQSQARPTTTTAASSSSSLPLSSSDAVLAPSSSVPGQSSPNSHINSAIGNSSSTSTLMSTSFNRSHNPVPPRTISDSSYMNNSASSSSLSILSYEIPETPAFHEDSDPERSPIRAQASAMSGSTSTSASLKTQRSIPSSSISTITAATQRQRPYYATTASMSSPDFPTIDPEPLVSPPAPVGLVESTRRRNAPFGINLDAVMPTGFGIVDDLGTPDQTPSETVLFEPSRPRQFEPVYDDEDDVQSVLATARPQGTFPRHSATSIDRGMIHSDRSNPLHGVEHDVDGEVDGDRNDYPYRYPHSHSHTPRYAIAHTPRGVPESMDQPRIQANPTTQSYSSVYQQSQSMPFDEPILLEDQQQATSTPPSPLLVPHGLNFSITSLEPPPNPTALRHLDESLESLLQPPVHESPSSESHLTTQMLTYGSSLPTVPRLAPTESQLQHNPIYLSHSYTTQVYSRSRTSAGMHLLPTTPPPHSVPPARLVEPFSGSSNTFVDESQLLLGEVNSQGGTDAESTFELTQLHPEGSGDDLVLPSLGYLDEALSFIAAERTRWTTARDVRAPTSSELVADVEDVDGEEDDGDWKHGIDGEQGVDQPKRKRRRKRPSKQSATSQGASSGIEASAGAPPPSIAEGSQSTPTSSPRKRRSKSAAPSSSSMRSLPLDKDSSATLGRSRKKGEKEFLVPVPSLPGSSSSSLKREKGKNKSFVTILKRPLEPMAADPALSDDDLDLDSDLDGGRTPTNALTSMASTLLSINLTGKKGKRVGRRERGREKLKLDMIKMSSQGSNADGSVGEEFEFGMDDDNDGDSSDDEDQQSDGQEENDSISNMSLLQPPRRKRDRSRRRQGKDTAYIHNIAGTSSAYKSTPGSPRRLTILDAEDLYDVSSRNGGPQEEVDGDIFSLKPNDVPGGEREREKKKRVRPKRSKALGEVQSFSQLKVDKELEDNPEAVADEGSKRLDTNSSRKGKKLATKGSEGLLEMDRNQLSHSPSTIPSSDPRQESAETTPPNSKRGRILALARQLLQIFPEQREELGRVVSRIEKQGATSESQARKLVASRDGGGMGSDDPKSSPITMSSKRSSIGRRSHVRTVSEGSINKPLDSESKSKTVGLKFPDIDEEDEEDEIDPRGRPPKKNDVLVHVFIDHSNILIGLLSHIKRMLSNRKPPNFARRKPLPTVFTKTPAIGLSNGKGDTQSAIATIKAQGTRPLPIPVSSLSSKRSQLIVTHGEIHPIPLPSFATTSHSLPSGSVLSAHMAKQSTGHLSEEVENQNGANSDGYEFPTTDGINSGDMVDDSFASEIKKKKKPPKHLWHSALALILERGRPVSRRVVVTSSPLYQPMESIERLGYELRVFIRVPDLGDGMDRERYKDKATLGRTNSGKTASSSPVTSTSFSTLPSSAKAVHRPGLGHVRRISGSTSAESGGGSNTHPYHGITNASTPQTKVKYREQGVDELLQLKLHQALAATDEVPEGSTIVLATGDGNMGQFNEDGFLGPVRTALRRGWKVELYAWEDGLSRAWRREFGDGTEWGKKGMFRIIGMEQFASALVKATDWT